MAPSTTKKKSKDDRPPATLNGEDWVNSDAKKLMVQDMLDGLVPVDKKIKDVKKLYDELYAHQPEFNNFPFDHTRYADQIARLQTNVRCLKWGASYDKELLEEARQKFPKQTLDPTGKILWDGSKADHYLDLDMAEGKHLVEGFKPSELRKTRECYMLFSPQRFSKRIDQKKEAAKPYGQNAMQTASRKKKEKKDVKVKNRPDISRAASTPAYNNN
jgi:hypothetical protein